MKELALTTFFALAWAASASAQVPEPTPQPAESLIPIETVDLRRSPRAIFCRRSLQVVDTVVFHHTETPVNTTTEEINQMHLNRGTATDPWLMIGYHFTIHAPYPTQRGTGRVTQGRPLDLVGAHAGSDAYKAVSAETVKLLQDPANVQCGPAEGPLTTATDTFNASGDVKANVNTVGIAVIGNYAQYHPQTNPSGYPRGRPRWPTASLIDMAARLSCQLQRENPRITKIYWHNYYKPTSCPGLIRERVAQIKAAARGYGCVFE